MKTTQKICCAIIAITGGELTTLILSLFFNDGKKMIEGFIALFINGIIIRFLFWDEAAEIYDKMKGIFSRR